jgi:hypothetical protein
MNREVGRFLLETWQLFYWSFFCPSLLQQRMNEWSPKMRSKEIQKDASASNILLFNASFRFVFQYLLVSASLSFPLIALICLSGQLWHLLLGLLAPLISYSLGLLFRPCGIGFCSPLLLGLAYWSQYKIFLKMLESALENLPPISRLSNGICLGSLLIFTTILVTKKLWHFERYYLSISLLIGILSGSSVLVGSWVVNQNLLFATYLAIVSSFFIIIFLTSISNNNEAVDIVISFAGYSALFCLILPVLLGLLFGMLIDRNSIMNGIVNGVVGGIIGSFVGGIVVFSIKSFVPGFVAITVLFSLSFSLVFGAAGIFNAPLHLFLLICALSALGCAPLKLKWLIVWLSVFFIAVEWGKLSFNAIWALPVLIISYYRIFPDYLLSCIGSLFYVQPWIKWFSVKPTSLLRNLPPYTTELLWLPLPNHERILSDTFHKNTVLGLATFQKMQAIPLPGFQLTIKKVLPLIVADQFAIVKNTTELIDSVTSIHPLLPLLIPTFYQSDEISQSSATSKSRNSEIDLLFPILQQIAKNTAAAIQGGSSALRERGLDKLVTQLIRLPAQLPGLGLKTQAIKRWQPAIERWQHILELEIAEQQKTSQGELLNPFQFGNPLRPDRAAIFKGRQDFADRLVRLILDRNRPTLVLHGPRRAGKTSFLLNLPRLLPSDLVPIYLDMQQGSMTASEGDFCYGLVRAIDRDTRSQGLQLPPIPSRQDFATQPYPTLEDWLDLALPKLGERRLLLNLDEFEKIGSAIKDNRISERLFDQLRSMIQHYDRLGFLFSGVQTLEELGPRWSNYFISVVPMEMHYLEPHEAEDLLLHPDPEFTFQYDAGIVDEILHLTRCQPYLLQLIGSALVNQANLQHTQLATTALLQAAIQDAFTNGEPYFTNIWTEFTGTTPAEVTAGQQILIALAQGNPLVETSEENTTAARRRLLRYHVIERDGDIDKIEIPLFEQWVRERSIAAS